MGDPRFRAARSCCADFNCRDRQRTRLDDQDDTLKRCPMGFALKQFNRLEMADPLSVEVKMKALETSCGATETGELLDGAKIEQVRCAAGSDEARRLGRLGGAPG